MDDFSKKHPAEEKPDSVIQDKILNSIKGSELPCAVAFSIAGELGVAAGEVGKTADLLDLRLTKCQLGLFGYTPEKKILKPLSDVDPDPASAVRKASVDNRLSCKEAWDIAASLKVPKMRISGACETMGIKIIKCQLGAF